MGDREGWEWGGEGERENKIKRVGKASPYPEGGEGEGRGGSGGRGPGSSVQRGCPQPTHTHPGYVQYKPQIITTAKEESKGSRVGPEVGKAEERARDKISHIYNFYISINLAPAGCMCVVEWD